MLLHVDCNPCGQLASGYDMLRPVKPTMIQNKTEHDLFVRRWLNINTGLYSATSFNKTRIHKTSHTSIITNLPDRTFV